MIITHNSAVADSPAGRLNLFRRVVFACAKPGGVGIAVSLFGIAMLLQLLQVVVATFKHNDGWHLDWSPFSDPLTMLVAMFTFYCLPIAGVGVLCGALSGVVCGVIVGAATRWSYVSENVDDDLGLRIAFYAVLFTVNLLVALKYGAFTLGYGYQPDKQLLLGQYVLMAIPVICATGWSYRRFSNWYWDEHWELE